MASILSTILLVISINLAPQKASKITIFLPNDKPLVLLRSQANMWTVKGAGVKCSSTSDKFTFVQGTRKTEVSIAEHIDIKGDINWPKIDTFSLPKEKIGIKLAKVKDGVNLVCSKKTEADDVTIKVRWEIPEE